MYESYGIHKKEWNKYKKLVEENCMSSKALSIKYNLTSVQLWFLFEKLLQGKFEILYEREKLTKECLRVGLYVSCKEYGRGKIISLNSNNLMVVHFNSRKLPTMCSQDGYTVHDETKRKITRV